MTPTANPGYVFYGWTGACKGTGPCVITLSEAKYVGAGFKVAGT